MCVYGVCIYVYVCVCVVCVCVCARACVFASMTALIIIHMKGAHNNWLKMFYSFQASSL